MYVDTCVLAVPEESKEEYLRIAEVFAEVARDLGALEIFENWEVDVPDGELTDFRRAVHAEPGEKLVVSWIIWPDHETAARAHEGMFNDPRIAQVGDMPFDGKRMIMGSFEPILAYQQG